MLTDNAFCTPLDDAIDDNMEHKSSDSSVVEHFSPLTYEGKCDSLIKVSLHVFLAAMIGSMVPVTLVTNHMHFQTPILTQMSVPIAKALIILILYVIISRFIGVLF